MNNKSLFIIVVILVVIVVLNKNNRENFETGPLPKKVLNNNCDIAIKDLQKTYTITNNACDDIGLENRPRTLQDHRLSCRNFQDRTMFMIDSANSWCDMTDKKIKIKNICPNTKFTGLGKLDYDNAKLKPYNSKIINKFPF